MKRRLSLSLSYLLPILAVAIVAFGYNQMRPLNMLCKQAYALCTSALCVPQPGDPAKAICFCDVEEGEGMSTQPCEMLHSSTDENGVRTIYSMFSLKQFNEGKKGMICPSGTPWTWCLNKPCTVDPSNPKKAICSCDVMRTGEWMTLGGNCELSTCSTGYWSGATLKDLEEGTLFMMKAQNLTSSPIKWCKVESP